jgi:hypothetical protein
MTACRTIPGGSRRPGPWVLLVLLALGPPAGADPPPWPAFRHHFIDRDLPGTQYGQTALADLDGDGDLDFTTGRNGDGNEIYWFEFRGPDRWTRHLLGSGHTSDVGGTTLDIDGDGRIDHVAGGHWFRNPGDPRHRPFDRIAFDEGLREVHDLIAADLDGDGRPEILTMSERNDLRWYAIPADPRRPWPRHAIGPAVHAGAAVGDLDGDGDPDVVRSDVWFENADGRGTRWVEHGGIPFGVPTGPYPLATRCVVRDIDRDGDADLVMTTNEIRAPQIAWIENREGRGMSWRRHDLAPGDAAVRGAYHSLAVTDFDGDGDLDVFTCEMEGVPGDRPPRWYIWENTDGQGARFVERVILDVGLGGHEAVVGDVDGDGDLDFTSKLWRPRPDNGNGGRNHADFLENLRIVRGDRQKDERRDGTDADQSPRVAAATDLSVVTDFPGGSARVESIDQVSRTIRLVPAEHPGRGWACWWSLRIDGIQPGETIVLEVGGMDFARVYASSTWPAASTLAR